MSTATIRGLARRLAATACALGAMAALAAHVGSPNVFYEGRAGPYPVRVVVRPPGVIPGLAEISVRVPRGDVRRVTVRPVRWDLGTRGAPRADEARPVAGEPRLWSAELWFMDFGSYSVHVAVEGAAGAGTVIVPVPAVATQTLGMRRGMALGLAGLGLFLFVGALTIVGAAVRESVLPPGEVPDARRRRRSWIARAVAVPILALAVLGGSRWWNAEDAAYANNLYAAPETEATVAPGADGGRVLTLAITDSTWNRFSPLLPDHGKLMHMFLVAERGMDAFAHVHPVRLDSARFRVALPPLPAGAYRVYADVVHESGFPQTFVDRVEIPAASGATSPSAGVDPDDSWRVGGAAGNTARLEDGSVMAWERGGQPLAAGREAPLRFRVTDAAGQAAVLEPYMGMMSHAAVARDDGSVFVHLHPAGSVSATAQQLFAQREAGDTTRTANGELVVRAPDHAAHAAGEAGVVSFPYEFPRPGRYRVWVQVKHRGRVLTGAFDADVR